MDTLENFEKIKDKKIIDKVLNFRNKSILYNNKYYPYINIDYIKKNNLILSPTYRIYDGKYEFGILPDFLKKSNFEYVYILLVNKYKEIKTKDYVQNLKKKEIIILQNLMKIITMNI